MKVNFPQSKGIAYETILTVKFYSYFVILKLFKNRFNFELNY